MFELILPQTTDELLTLFLATLEWFLVFLLGRNVYQSYRNFKRIQRMEQSTFTKIFHSDNGVANRMKKLKHLGFMGTAGVRNA